MVIEHFRNNKVKFLVYFGLEIELLGLVVVQVVNECLLVYVVLLRVQNLLELLELHRIEKQHLVLLIHVFLKVLIQILNGIRTQTGQQLLQFLSIFKVNI